MDTLALRDSCRMTDGASGSLTVRFNHLASGASAPAPGTRVLVETVAGEQPDGYRLLTLSGALITEFRLEDQRMAMLMAAPEFVVAEVVFPNQPDRETMFSVRFESL